MTSWRDVNGKKIRYQTKEGNIFEAIVIANPEVGVSVKPFDPEEVLSKEPRGWGISPTDPNFFFICTSATEKNNKEMFDQWVETFAKDKEYFTVEDITGKPSLFMGFCPFSHK